MAKIIVVFKHTLINGKVINVTADEYADYELADLGYMDQEIDNDIKGLTRDIGVLRSDILKVDIVNKETSQTIHTKKIN